MDLIGNWDVARRAVDLQFFSLVIQSVVWILRYCVYGVCDGGVELVVMRLWQLQPLNFIVEGASSWRARGDETDLMD